MSWFRFPIKKRPKNNSKYYGLNLFFLGRYLQPWSCAYWLWPVCLPSAGIALTPSFDHTQNVSCPMAEFTRSPPSRFLIFPMNLDLLYLPALYLKNDIAPKYIHFVFALLTAGAAPSVFKACTKPDFTDWLGPYFFLTLPVIVKLSVTRVCGFGVDFSFSWAGLYLVVRWYDTDFYTAVSRPWQGSPAVLLWETKIQRIDSDSHHGGP